MMSCTGIKPTWLAGVLLGLSLALLAGSSLSAPVQVQVLPRSELAEIGKELVLDIVITPAPGERILVAGLAVTVDTGEARVLDEPYPLVIQTQPSAADQAAYEGPVRLEWAAPVPPDIAATDFELKVTVSAATSGGAVEPGLWTRDHGRVGLRRGMVRRQDHRLHRPPRPAVVPGRGLRLRPADEPVPLHLPDDPHHAGGHRGPEPGEGRPARTGHVGDLCGGHGPGLRHPRGAQRDGFQRHHRLHAEPDRAHSHGPAAGRPLLQHVRRLRTAGARLPARPPARTGRFQPRRAVRCLRDGDGRRPGGLALRRALPGGAAGLGGHHRQLGAGASSPCSPSASAWVCCSSASARSRPCWGPCPRAAAGWIPSRRAWACCWWPWPSISSGPAGAARAHLLSPGGRDRHPHGRLHGRLRLAGRRRPAGGLAPARAWAWWSSSPACSCWAGLLPDARIPDALAAGWPGTRRLRTRHRGCWPGGGTGDRDRRRGRRACCRRRSRGP